MTKPRTLRATMSTEEIAVLTTYMAQLSDKIDFQVAAADTGLPAELLRKLVRDGVLAGTAPWRVTDIVGSCDIHQARQLARQLDQARAEVEGNSIGVTEAAAKYRFGRGTIYGWLKSGWMKPMGKAPNGDLLLNEGDVAFARTLANLAGQKAGKPVFPKRPYS